jgi:tetrapyrrole methylase family protein / MazG family protein
MSAAGSQRIDELLAEAGLDPALGVQAAAAGRLAGIAFDPSLPLLLLPDPRGSEGGDVLPGRHARAGARDVLAALYPLDHELLELPGRVPHRLGDLDDGVLRAGAWLVPPLGLTENLASPHGIAAISARLRAPDGCPWDRRQTHLTLRPYLLEEAYETLDAIEHGAPADLAEELGDLLLQVVLHAQFAAEDGVFDLTDVYRSIAGKIVRRHPHVFGGLEVAGVDEVLANWETIKAGERAERGKEAQGAFGGVARALPALPASREIQERASSLGWDWDAIEGVWEKVAEELDELRAASSDDDRLHEIGDVLFALVNLARWMMVDPEEALRAANHRWVARYRRVEALAASRGVDLDALSLAEKDLLWDEVKGG